MASSPDSAPATEYASSAVPPRPRLLRNLSFWLLTMLLGSVGILVAPVLKSGFTSKATATFLTVGGLATLLSLAALPLLLLRLPWALTASSVGRRWLRVFSLQCLSLSGLTTLGYLLAGSMLGPAALVGGTVYFVAGLLVAEWCTAPGYAICSSFITGSKPEGYGGSSLLACVNLHQSARSLKNGRRPNVGLV